MRHRNAKIILATVAITGVVGAGVAVAADAPTCPYSNTPKAAQNAPAQGERQRSRNCGRASETPARTRSLPPRRGRSDRTRACARSGGPPGPVSATSTEAHGGRVEVTDNNGAGARFIVALPIG
jgi:hypothetical protein